MSAPMCTCGHEYRVHVGPGRCTVCDCSGVMVSVKPEKPTSPPNVPTPGLPPNPHRAGGGYLPHELPIEYQIRLTKAYIGGTFDLLHPGHIWLLERVKTHCDLVVVSLNTDEFNMRYKDRAPIMSLSERMRMLRALRVVDGVMINEHGEDSKPGVVAASRIGNPGEQEHPVTHIVHGSDWQGDSLMEQLQVTPEWLEERGIEMLYIDLSEGYSTTDIRLRVFDSQRNFGDR